MSKDKYTYTDSFTPPLEGPGEAVKDKTTHPGSFSPPVGGSGGLSIPANCALRWAPALLLKEFVDVCR